MRVMAFCMDEERLRIIEFNRARFPDLYSTPIYEHLMELVVQDNYAYEQLLEHNRFRMNEYQRRYVAELALAHAHIKIMYDAVSESWQQQSAFDWLVSHGMSPEEAAARVAQKKEAAA